MNLKPKIVVSLIVVFSCYLAIDIAIQQYVVFPRFVMLEQQEAIKNLKRCHQAIERDLEHLDMFVHDWAAWDDIHQYAVDGNQQFADENFVESVYPDADLNLISVLNLDHEVVYQGVRGFDNQTEIQISLFPDNQWEADHPLLQHGVTSDDLAKQVCKGLIMTEHGPMLVASRPILSSNNRPPPHGTLVMGRFVDEDAVASIAEQTEVQFSLQPIDNGLQVKEQTTNFDVQMLDRDNLAVHGALHSLTGEAILATKADVPRSISGEGRVATQYAVVSLVAVAAIVMVLLLGLLQKIVIGPLLLLTSQATKIASTGDMTTRVNLQRSDELGTLSNQFDTMVEQLDEYHRKMVDMSRQAGMSDVATSVLHNVGNIITNVGVLSSDITRDIENSKVSGLTKSVQLINSQDDKATFFSSDERGRRLPAYLSQLADTLQQERTSNLSRLESLESNLANVNQILETQQALVKKGDVAESIQLTKFLSGVITMIQASLDRHNISLSVECPELPSVKVDRSKFSQLLLNLITNAKDAVKDRPVRKIHLSAEQFGPDQFRISVSDTGFGIDPEHLTRVFSSEFSTKVAGHGQGLHLCALAAKEMGGSIQASSEGRECGATFSVTLPTRSPAEALA